MGDEVSFEIEERQGRTSAVRVTRLRPGTLPPPPRAQGVVERADASTTSLIDAATLAERIRTALGAESLGEALPEVPVRLVPDPEEDPREATPDAPPALLAPKLFGT